MRTLSAVLVFSVVAVPLAGCSVGDKTLDAGKMQRKITDTVKTQVGARVKSVKCPHDRKVKKGDVFTCTVTGIDATEGKATVTQRDDDGNVIYRAPFLHVRQAEALIAARIKAQVKVTHLRVKCPEIITPKTGGTFDCQAADDGGKATVRATMTNDHGGFVPKVLNGQGG